MAAETQVEQMRAVILAGGKGTRLRPYTAVLPKPLVPIGNGPILGSGNSPAGARNGFSRIELSVGHLGALIKAYLRPGSNSRTDSRAPLRLGGPRPRGPPAR